MLELDITPIELQSGQMSPDAERRDMECLLGLQGNAAAPSAEYVSHEQKD